MNTLKPCFLVLFLSGMMSLQAYSQDEFANVDEVYDLIKGNWYQIIDYNGMTGKQDSVYQDHINQIERIPGTDSIIWKISLHDSLLVTIKYKMEFTLSYILHRNKWILNDGWAHYLIFKASYGFATAWDTPDGGARGFARKKLSTSINNPLHNNALLTLFPNPANSSFTVRGVENVENILIFDIKGNTLQWTAHPEPSAVVDMSAFSNGIYLVQVISKSGVYTGKVIKE